MMSMTFEASNNVTLLFDFWEVHSPAGMALTVIVVLLFTLLYEFLKVWRVWLSSSSSMVATLPPYTRSIQGDSNSALDYTPSEPPLTPHLLKSFFPKTRDSWLLHAVQTLLHLLQVTLGYMLMLCVMTYNTWIFIAVVVGSVLGYFLSYPLISRS